MPRLERLPEPHIDYAYGLFLLKKKHRLIKALNKRYKPSVHGDRTWESAFVMMDYLSHNPIKKNSTFMEIGCGWGGVAIFAGHHFNAKVTAVDLDPAVFPYLNVLAEINSVEVRKRCRDFTKMPGNLLGEQNVIVGSDVCFWDSLVDPLVKMTWRALKNGTKRVVIADPGRPTFYEFCDKVGAKSRVSLQEWYCIEPDRHIGEVVEVRPR